MPSMITSDKAPAAPMPWPTTARAPALDARKTAPVKVWAAVGAVILAFEAYVLTKWITGPYLTGVPVGPSDPPTWMKVAIRSVEIAMFIAFAWCICWFLVRPWRKERRLTVDGMLLLGFFLVVWFQDALVNYSGIWYTNNAYLLNVGSWLNDVPGALSPGKPGAQFFEPLLWGAAYPSLIFVSAILGCWVMREAKARWPRMGTLGLLGVCFAFFFVYDFVLEAFVLMPLGIYTYAGGPDWSSINVSHYYKFTVLEPVTFGAAWTAWAALRYFKNDKGETIAERGIGELRATPKQKTALRFLAICGALGVAMFAFVSLPDQWLAIHSGPFPQDVQKRSYFTNGICGEGTSDACPAPNIPLPRGNDSLRVGPNGTLLTPTGTEAPKPVPIAIR